MTPKLESLLDRLMHVVSEEYRRGYLDHEDIGQGSCIKTCRILKTVLRHFGFESSPVSVSIRVFNPIATKVIKDNAGSLRSLDELFETMTKTEGARFLECSPMNGGLWDGQGGYNAHVVLVCQDVAIDATVQQFNRPAKNIMLPPMVVTPADKDGAWGTEVNRCFIVMNATGDQSFRRSPAWTNEDGVVPNGTKRSRILLEREVTNRIIERAKRG